jgi:hypothetical protein
MNPSGAGMNSTAILIRRICELRTILIWERRHVGLNI